MDVTITQEIIDRYASRLVEPWRLYPKPLHNYKIVDGYLMHINANTRIGAMETQSDIFNQYMDVMLNNLQLWHEFANDNDIIYTLIASNLISHYCSGGMLPWEDDIDLSVRERDWKKLVSMYNELELAHDIIDKYPGMCTLFRPKALPGTELVLCRCRAPGKMKVVNLDRFKFYDQRPVPKGMRGIDISCAIEVSNSYIESFWAYRRFYPVCPGPGDWMSADECPEVQFSGVTTRAIQPDFGYPYLINRYGTKWDAMIQPRLIDKSKGHIPCRMQDKSKNKEIAAIIESACK